MQQRKQRIVTAVLVIFLMFLSLQFVNRICQMAFENTCTELEEQYLTTEVSAVVDTMESSINFGKELRNYYGIDEVFARVRRLSDQELRVIIFDADGAPLYTSFEASEETERELAYAYTAAYKKHLLETEQAGASVAFDKKNSLVFPIYKDGTERIGYLSVYYDADALLEGTKRVHTQPVLFLVLAVTAVFVLLFQKKEGKKKALFMMLGMFCYIVFLFFTYRADYHSLIEEKAGQMAASVQNTAEELMEKGLTADGLYRLEDWLREKEETSEAIRNLRFHIGERDAEVADGTLVLPIGTGEAQLEAEINQAYIREKINLMTLTLGAVFAVCLMIALELANLAEILAVRLSGDFNRPTEQQEKGISAQIRLLSFIGYVAIYTSTPYAAVIMRSWDASVFGLSEAVSASLPLTVELICVLAASALIQKVYQDTRPNRLMGFVFPFLILGNVACMAVTSPYLLIALRAFCGIGFAFLKYWLNSIVAAGSFGEKSFRDNCGRLNAGLLGGITAGASLGAIFAEALGYQANYLVSAAILLLLCVWAFFTMPWKLLELNRSKAVETEAAADAPQAGMAGQVLKNKKALLTLLLGCVPLNIGLMYVVAFVPSYMDSIGQNAVATSYVYLVNGLAGMYLGVLILNFMKKRPLYISCTAALFLAAGGILLLPVSKSLAVVMLSAAIMGVFDGFGTPSITSYFTELSADPAQTAGMLTVFHMAGSAVQILCPMLYNLLIQPDGKMTYLILFGIAFLFAAVLFLLISKPKRKGAKA